MRVTCGPSFLSGLLLGLAPLFFWEFCNRQRVSLVWCDTTSTGMKNERIQWGDDLRRKRKVWFNVVSSTICTRRFNKFVPVLQLSMRRHICDRIEFSTPRVCQVSLSFIKIKRSHVFVSDWRDIQEHSSCSECYKTKVTTNHYDFICTSCLNRHSNLNHQTIIALGACSHIHVAKCSSVQFQCNEGNVVVFQDVEGNKFPGCMGILTAHSSLFTQMTFNCTSLKE